MKILLLSIFAIITLWHKAYSQETFNFQFEKVSHLENLPNNEILSLYQDSDGFIWIATTGGLYQFDGYDLTEYRSNVYNFNLLTHNRITCLKEDSQKNLYIGTNEGLNILNKRTGKIKKSQCSYFSKNYIASIVETTDQEIWIGTDSGLYNYYLKNDSCIKILNKMIRGMFVDSKGDIWAGTWSGGLHRYSKKDKKWIKYPPINEYNSAHVIFEDSQHRIWVGSFGKGIMLLHNPYDLETLSWTTFSSEDAHNKISDNYIYSITENPDTKTLWFGTRKGISITQISPQKDSIRWNNIYPSNRPNALPFNEVDALINDKQGNIWVGTLGGGICYVKTKYLGFQANKMPEVYQKSQSNSIRSLLIDKQKQIWTGIGTSGLAIQNTLTGEITIHQNIDWLSDINNFTRIHSMIQSSVNGHILLGTQSGLYVYNPKHPHQSPTKINHRAILQRPIYQIIESNFGGYWIAGKRFICHQEANNQQEVLTLQEDNDFNTLIQTNSNTIWAGTTSEGIVQIIIDPATLKAKNTKRYNIQNGLSPASNIKYLYQDRDKNIWVGTDGGGLCTYDETEDKFISINQVTDFPTDLIVSITEDEEGTLWLGSNIGLIRFYPSKNLKNSSFRLYNKSNGLPDNTFLPGAVTQTEEGEIYFGTHQGYIHFFSSEINTPERSNEVFITDLKLDNHSISSLDSIEQKKICPLIPGFSSQVRIPHNYSNFTIEFAPMVFTTPNKVRYAYKLEGYDKEWQYTTASKRFAHYANLSAGTYHFKLKSTNEYGNWNEMTRNMEITIIPPLWKTWWAYALYSLLILLVILYFYRSAKQRLKLQTEVRIQQIEREKNDELNQAKLRFFTNITHELFTPITIIAAAMEEIHKLVPQREYEVIVTNTNRLIRLIQQILEFRKAETGNLQLQVSKQNLSHFISQNIESFQPLMKKKQINISFIDDTLEKETYFDADKLDKILYNLLSNALKYNKEGASVIVSLSYQEEKYARISVSDNGNGLSEKAMKNLFKRFYDGDFRKFKTTGTGIGLSLVKDLVNLHKGEITVENHPEEGVNFIIQIPINASDYTEEECNEKKLQNEISQINDVEEELTENGTAYNLLVVEDNPDLLLLLKNILSNRYNIYTATNGKEAVEVMIQEDINLIVSDVMMPEMNGYELCQKIKQDVEFSHIPIILLTAKIEEADAVNAYKSGADAYLTKPFSVSRLQARVVNLLNRRAQSISCFKKQENFEPHALEYTTHDEAFLKSVLECINKHYTNPEFDQNKLTDLMGISKSTMHRKLKSLTGMTASNLIKDVRLKTAREMLKKKGSPRISEIAYAVGFNDPKYFSTCFKKEFGMLPRRFDPENSEDSIDME
ncbi:hybrid sensor histidine kinase/response regulator transcription factor [Bacteroides cellulosilyticus]|uniref:hybrid sensor histidine kinase/response regulator transcription factor n=2 Tax=Bacteroides TaxID=816 RepID=UPI0018A9FE1A|nr:two-component regulator propeller domain-containing protein [Bacteroides cellulosilyticus]